MSRKGGSFAVLIGAIVGVSAALARRGEAPVAPPPGTALPIETARPEPSVAAITVEPAPTARGSVQLSSSTAPPPSPLAGGSASASPVFRTEVAPVTTPAELQALEVRCYAQDPVACRRAAAAYDTGQIVPRDSVRARNYRKVELTQIVRLCEKRLPHACLMLAELYATGDGVKQSARRAQQLQKHARDLCQRRPSAECQSLGAF